MRRIVPVSSNPSPSSMMILKDSRFFPNFSQQGPCCRSTDMKRWSPGPRISSCPPPDYSSRAGKSILCIIAWSISRSIARRAGPFGKPI